MTNLADQTAVITGSARGIGKAIALRYASLGANIVVNYSGDDANATTAVAEIRDYGVEAVAARSHRTPDA